MAEKKLLLDVLLDSPDKLNKKEKELQKLLRDTIAGRKKVKPPYSIITRSILMGIPIKYGFDDSNKFPEKNEQLFFSFSNSSIREALEYFSLKDRKISVMDLVDLFLFAKKYFHPVFTNDSIEFTDRLYRADIDEFPLSKETSDFLKSLCRGIERMALEHERNMFKPKTPEKGKGGGPVRKRRPRK